MLDYFDRFADARKKIKIPIDKVQARDNFNYVVEAMNRAGLEFWLSFGTLLGAVREHDFIAHDIDTDIGCHIEDMEVVVNVILNELMEKGFDFVRFSGCLATVVRDGAYLDFYWFHPVVNKKTGKKGLCCNDYIVPDDGFVKTYFAGQCVNIPVKAEVLLEKWYGKDWRVPKKGVIAKHGW